MVRFEVLESVVVHDVTLNIAPASAFGPESPAYSGAGSVNVEGPKAVLTGTNRKGPIDQRSVATVALG
jgi:hypothetical protein